MSAGGIAEPHDRSLNRRSSKSRLEKQHEVEDEDPPGGRGASRGDVEKKMVDSGSQKVTTEGQLSLSKIQIPETRVESFDNVEAEDDEKGAPAKSKVLVRSHALCGDDDTKLNARGIEKQSSAGSSLSRDSSNELYTDSTGINLEEFIVNTLHKNPRDRTFLLDLEKTLSQFIQDTSGRQIHRFPTMSSYNRMLVHRVAAFFGLDHNVDQSGQAVVVARMPTTRIPDVPFKEYIKNDFFTDEPKKLLKRDAQSYEEGAQARSLDQPDIRKARSFEEREEENAKARARIFNQQDSSSSMEGVMESPVRPWSSTDSSSDQSQISFMQMQRAQLMQKAGSFGGMPTLYRGDGAKISPRRSNTESTRGDVGFPRQPTIPEASSDPSSPPVGASGQPVIFAVASIDQVPPGAVIINSQTGQPYFNPDGSIYRHAVYTPRHSSAAPTPFAPPLPTALLPFCGTNLSADPCASVTGQMQQLNLMQPTGVSVLPDPSRSAVASPQVYYGTPQVYTYVMSQQQLGQQQAPPPPPPPPQASDGSPQRLPPASSQTPNLLTAQTAGGYMQPVSVQYQESVSYAVHTGHLPYTQAPTQGTVSMTTSPIGYRMFYAPNTLSPVPVATTPNQAAHVMVPTVGVPYATAQPSMHLAEGAEGTSMILEQAAPQMQFGHAGAGYAASVSSGDSAAAGFSGSSLVTATVSEGVSDSSSSAGGP